MGPPPCWASIGTDVVAYGRNGHGDAFPHYQLTITTAIVIDSLLVLQHRREKEVTRRHTVPGDGDVVLASVSVSGDEPSFVPIVVSSASVRPLLVPRSSTYGRALCP